MVSGSGALASAATQFGTESNGRVSDTLVPGIAAYCGRVDLNEELRSLAERHLPELDDLRWASEADRWAELIFCVLNSFAEDAPERCRLATGTLAELDLLAPATLAGVDDPHSEAHIMAKHVLRLHGFTEANLAGVLGALGTVSRQTIAGFDGKLQRYLRQLGEAARDSLAARFGDSPQLRRAVTHWLQNTLNLPLSLEDQAVREFCERLAITQADLEAAADSIDLNVAVVDDIIGLAAARESRG